MKFMPQTRKTALAYLNLSILALIVTACSFRLFSEPSSIDSPEPTTTPTLAPVATTSFNLLPTIVAPEHLVADPEEIDPFPDVEDCDPEWVRSEVLAEAIEDDEGSEIEINCHLTLSRDARVTKRLIFQTSGVTLDCNGALITGGDGTAMSPNNVNFRKDMIEIRSQYFIEDESWKSTQSVTIRDCNILGSIRVWGMGRVGEGFGFRTSNGRVNHFRISSREEGHTERARANAPRNITIDNITITGVGRIPIYFSPGVSYSKIVNSRLLGVSTSVAIYFDAESYYNTLRNNYIDVETNREVLALDGSGHNRIINNWFSNLEDGGIYLYRNCGEGGVIRHSTPSFNHIVNNIFYYANYDGPNPAVYLGSRDGNRSYCGEDSGFDFGSSVSNRDYATHNVVMQNQIFVRSVSDMIKTQNQSINSPNYIDYNHTVNTSTVILNGLAGCYVADGYRDFILHGQVVDVYRGSNNIPTCTDYRDVCSDGELIRTTNNSCALTSVNFDCTISGDNDGCSQTVSCPNITRTLAATAACNLEWGPVEDETLMSLRGNTISVVRSSDAVWSGSCNVGNNALSFGSRSIEGIQGSFAVNVGCSEYDQNGGDCQIRGTLYCR